MTSVFVSYSSADRERIRPFVDAMRTWGLEVWIDVADLEGGGQWIDEIGLAIGRCSIFVVFLSPDAVNSRMVASELRLAFQSNKRIVPVQLSPAPLVGPFLLALSGTQLVVPAANGLDRLHATLASEGLVARRPPPLVMSRTGSGDKRFIFSGNRLGLGRARFENDDRVDIVARLLPDSALDISTCRSRSKLISQFHAEIFCSESAFTVTNYGKHGITLHAGYSEAIASSIGALVRTPDDVPPARDAQRDERYLGMRESITDKHELEFSLGVSLLRLRLQTLVDGSGRIQALWLDRVDNCRNHSYMLVLGETGTNLFVGGVPLGEQQKAREAPFKREGARLLVADRNNAWIDLHEVTHLGRIAVHPFEFRAANSDDFLSAT